MIDNYELVYKKYVELQHMYLSSMPGANVFASDFNEDEAGFNPKEVTAKEHGLPQGSPTSPFLSLLVIEKYLYKEVTEAGHNLIMYADDGLIYSEKEINFTPSKLTEDSGMKFNPEKCSHVKINGL